MQAMMRTTGSADTRSVSLACVITTVTMFVEREIHIEGERFPADDDLNGDWGLIEGRKRVKVDVVPS